MQIGSLVECVNDVFPIELINLIPNRPKLKNIYTVREILKLKDNIISIRLDEINNPKNVKYKGIMSEPAFKIDRFREIQDIPDIEMIMEEILCLQN